MGGNYHSPGRVVHPEITHKVEGPKRFGNTTARGRLSMADAPVVLVVTFRGRTKTIAAAADGDVAEVEDLLAALFLTDEECAAGIRPAGFALPADCYVSLPAACADLVTISSFGQPLRLLVAFPLGEGEAGSGEGCCGVAWGIMFRGLCAVFELDPVLRPAVCACVSQRRKSLRMWRPSRSS